MIPKSGHTQTPRNRDVAALIQNARALREKTRRYPLEEKELIRAKNSRRP